MPTVGDSVKSLTGNRKTIYDYIEQCWIEQSYVPSIRNIAHETVIPFSTVVHHISKLIEADLMYRIGKEGTLILRGAITSIDPIEWCNPTETAYRPVGSQVGEKTE